MVLGNITPCRPLSTMTTQKLIYTCRWLESHMDVDHFNSDGLLPHWQLCWSHYRWRVRLQDWLHSGDKFSIAFKVSYISEDLLPVTVTSRSWLYFSPICHKNKWPHLLSILLECLWNLINYCSWEEHFPCSVNSEPPQLDVGPLQFKIKCIYFLPLTDIS